MTRLIVHGRTMMLAMTLSLLALLCWRAPVHAQTTVPGGTIGSDATWTLAGSPYLVQGSVTVGPNATLTIEPGVAVRTQGAHLLQVAGGGTLIAEGTVEQPITFGSANANPQAGDWNYLWFYSSSRVRLAHCTIQHAGRNSYASIYVASNDVQIRNCTVANGLNEGLLLNGAGLTPLLENVTVQGHGKAAVRQNTIDMQPTYRNLTLSDNGLDAVLSAGGNLGRDITLDGSPAALNGRPLVVEGAIGVGADRVLTLTPGTQLRWSGAHLLQVADGGTLIAEGTVEQPITFTTHSATPASGAWNYLMFEAGSRGTLRNCTIEYAGAGNHAAIYLRSSSVTVHYCRIQRNKNEGVQVTNATPHLRFNQINDNGFGVRNTTPALVINATSNWWGSYLGPHHPVLNRYGKGNAVSNGVHFDPWSLSESVGALEIRALDAAVPAEVSNLGRATLELIGAGFHLTPTVQLLAPDGNALSPVNLTMPNQFLMRATFDFTGRPLGAYAVRIDWAGGHAETLSNAVQVVEGKGGNVWAKLNVPGAVRSGRSFLFTLEYGNDGDSDAPAPWLTVQTSPGMRWQVLDGDPISTPTFNLMAISPDGDGGILAPGAQSSITFSATWSTDMVDPIILYWFAKPTQMLTPTQMIRLAGGDPTQAPWPTIAQKLETRFGNDFDTYKRTLTTLASEASDLGFPIVQVEELLVFAVNQAAAELLISNIAAVGAVAPMSPTADRPVCIEMHDQYATDPSTYGIGSRTRDGRWVPWRGGEWLEPDVLDLTNYFAQATIFGNATRVYFWDSVVKEWVDLFLSGSGHPWYADWNHPVSTKAVNLIATVPKLHKPIESRIENALIDYAASHDIPEGFSTVRLSTMTVPGVRFAQTQKPDIGNALWNLGETTLVLGRGPYGGNSDFEVELFRPADSFRVHFTAKNIPARIEDVFQIWEEKVNAACKLKATNARCPGAKGDWRLLFEWAYMLDVFGPARCFDWYIGMSIPKIEGYFSIAGVEANAGEDFSVMLPEGAAFVDVTLRGTAKLESAVLMGAGDSKRPFVWSGLPVNPPDVQSPVVRLPEGVYVFVLQVNAKGQGRYAGMEFADLDSITVRVLPYDPDDDKRPRPARSWDPNDKVAPAGFDNANTVLVTDTLPYIINFENDPKLANAPAQEVRIIDQLDANLDWSSLEFSEFGIGTHIFSVEAGKKYFWTEVDLTPDGIDHYVTVEGRFDADTGVIYWTFISLDPLTRQPSTDPFAGFLPPNDSSRRGEGFVSFKIRSLADRPVGTQIPNKASIVFDDNPPIITNTATVTIGVRSPAGASRRIFLPVISR
ncbi:MAG: right-handed parallel beta-helix repeat-containing protein [Caldilinea sp.]